MLETQTRPVSPEVLNIGDGNGGIVNHVVDNSINSDGDRVPRQNLVKIFI